MIRAVVTAVVSGGLFGAGLVVSGMTDPANVQGFLDVTGDFRPSLALVMVGAILVYGVAIRLPGERARPFASIGPRPRLDAELLVGAALFGVGWGLGGYCPGPSLVALGAGQTGAVVFVGASVVGLLLGEGVVNRRRERRAERHPVPQPSAVESG